jgi:hypothetical protein
LASCKLDNHSSAIGEGEQFDLFPEEITMKEMIRRPLLTLILLGSIVPVTAGIQIINRVTFSTTFPFTAGNTKLPAGSYSIRPLDDDSEIMEISSADGKTSALFETMTAELPRTPSKGEVVFKKYGDSYVLSEIYEPGSKLGAMTIKSHAERQHAKKSGAPTKESVPTTKTTQ